MSFDKLDIKDNSAREGRACILVCNLVGKDLQKVKNCAMILGIRDQIILNSKNGNTVIKDVLDNNINAEFPISYTIHFNSRDVSLSFILNLFSYRIMIT